MSPNLQVEFHVHTYASLLGIGVMLSQNLVGIGLFGQQTTSFKENN
jgi:hypothetical protein